jgi:hypothetical protein
MTWGAFACGVAFHAGELGSLVEAVNQIGSFFYGSLLGVFLLAFFVKGAGGVGAFHGFWGCSPSLWFHSPPRLPGSTTMWWGPG